MVIDALEEIIGHGSLLYLQRFGGSRFGATAASLTAATKLVAQGNLQLNGHTIALEQVRPLVTHVSVYRVPPYVTDESLLSVLRPYGTISHVEHVSYRDRPQIGTGTRVVRIAMTKPLPNFIRVQGYRVTVEYRGMRRVCVRSGQEGHMGAGFTTPRCTVAVCVVTPPTAARLPAAAALATIPPPIALSLISTPPSHVAMYLASPQARRHQPLQPRQ